MPHTLRTHLEPAIGMEKISWTASHVLVSLLPTNPLRTMAMRKCVDEATKGWKRYYEELARNEERLTALVGFLKKENSLLIQPCYSAPAGRRWV